MSLNTDKILLVSLVAPKIIGLTELDVLLVVVRLITSLALSKAAVTPVEEDELFIQFNTDCSVTEVLVILNCLPSIVNVPAVTGL